MQKKEKKRQGDPRDMIDATALIMVLEQHALGEKEMSSTQVSAALALLKKTIPDLSEPSRRSVQAAEAQLNYEDALKELE